MITYLALLLVHTVVRRYEYFERTILPMMGRLLALFQGISALNVILQRCMDTIMNHFGAESVVGRREQLFNKLALEADEFASRFHLKVPLPPVLDVLVASMSDVAISDATRTGGRKFLSQVYERLCLSNGTTTKRIRWMREHFRAVMKHMDKRVHPYVFFADLAAVRAYSRGRAGTWRRC